MVFPNNQIGPENENFAVPAPQGGASIPVGNSYGQMFRARLLAERSRLEFHYGGADVPIIFLPFYENPVITESQAASYAEYNPIARGGSLFSYLGSKSRKFKVEFYYTIPHLAFHDMGINRFLRVFGGNSPEAKKAMFKGTQEYTPTVKPGDSNKSLAVAQNQLYLYLRNLQVSPSNTPGSDENYLEKLGSLIGSTIQSVIALVGRSELNRVIDTLLFFVGVIRTSVVNNSNNPMLSPPIVRITHGTMYQSVPTICKNYSISFVEEAGYDLETLTPNRVKIQMQLEEVRVGDFGEYQPATLIARDNLTGWESAIASPFTTDPLPAEGFWKES